MPLHDFDEIYSWGVFKKINQNKHKYARFHTIKRKTTGNNAVFSYE